MSKYKNNNQHNSGTKTADERTNERRAAKRQRMLDKKERGKDDPHPDLAVIALLLSS